MKLSAPLVAATAILLAAPAIASADPCSPQVGQVQWSVTDKSDERVANGDMKAALPPRLPTTHRLEIYAQAVMPESGNTSADQVRLSLPAGVPFVRDGSSIVFTAAAAGPLPVTATWTETTRNTHPPDIVCTASAVGTLNLVAATRPRVTVLAKAVQTSRPQLEIVIAASRGQFGDARDIVVRAKGTRVARPPTGLLRTLFTLPFSDDSRANSNPSERAIPLGSISGEGGRAAAKVDVLVGEFLGNGNVISALERRRGGPKPLTRTGVAVDLLQGGRVIGGVRTGVVCGVDVGQTPRIVKGRWINARRTCRVVGYRTL